MAKYHHFEVASATFQIGIVLAPATIITGVIALAWAAGLLVVTAWHLQVSDCSRPIPHLM